MKKLLSVILAVLMLFSIFSISVSAKTMTKAEVVKFYHSILKQTAEKNKLIFAQNKWKEKDEADLSGISGLDLYVTKDMYSYADGVWYEFSEEDYFYGVNTEYQDAGYTNFYISFCISNKIDYGYEVTKATYANNKIVIELEDESEYYSYTKVTVNLAKDNTLKSIIEETRDEYTDYSVLKDIPFDATYEVVNNYTFMYEKVPAKSLTLSETSITLGYADTAELTYTVGPENATFKNVEVNDAWSENDDFIAYAYEEDGKIYIEANEEGTGIVEVCTVSGNILATCEVTVEYSFTDRIRIFFDDIIFWIEMLFMIW